MRCRSTSLFTPFTCETESPVGREKSLFTSRTVGLVLGGRPLLRGCSFTGLPWLSTSDDHCESLGDDAAGPAAGSRGSCGDGAD